MGQTRRKETEQERRPTEGPASASATPTEGSEPPLLPPAMTQQGPWQKPASLGRRGWMVIGLVVFVIQLPLLHRFLLRGEQEAPLSIAQGYTQDFGDPAVVARDYWTTGGHWRVVDGELLSPGVKNNPLWLKGALPRDVVIEFDVRSQSPEGDIKVELFGDGLNHASGYVFVHGGWNNSLSIIARLDEHGTSLKALQTRAQRRAARSGGDANDLVAQRVFKPDTRMRVEANPFKVELGRVYHWRIERKGKLLRWLIDGEPFMEFEDPFPLEGKGHDRFGFSSWDANLYFDNLVIRPL